ncbi:MAG TPA: PH domain-containing protein [Mycobacteriales bacterium]|nr:PH domain-containing protein [Mycobacteriales bacterium]
MAFPQRLLADGEEVVLDLHPHWKELLGPLAALPVVVGAVSYGVFAMPDGRWHRIGQYVVLAAGLLVLVVRSLVPWLRWRTTSFVLTTARLVIRQGVLSRTGRDIPLTRVNDVSYRHGPLQRLLRCGTLVVESAGERGQIVLADVPRVETVQRELYRRVEAAVPGRPAGERA